jgi:tetratricopeptide (TPR) repeat protein
MVGTLLQLQGKLDEAKVQYEKVLGLDNRAAAASNNLAQLYVDRNENLDVALQLAQTAKAGMPASHEVDDTLGWIYYKKGAAPLAITSLKQAVAAAPANAVYLYHLGAAYALNKDKVNARQTLEKALKLQPGFPGADDARKILDSLKG